MNLAESRPRHDVWTGWGGLLLLVSGSVAVGALGATAALAADPAAPYGHLALPWWTPQLWALGATTLAIHALAGISAWLIVRQKNEVGVLVRWAMPIYALQLALGALVTVALFGLYAPGVALGIAIVLLGTIMFTMLRFSLLSRDAWWLQVPFLVATGLAIAFTGAVYVLNPDAPFVATPPLTLPFSLSI